VTRHDLTASPSTASHAIARGTTGGTGPIGVHRAGRCGTSRGSPRASAGVPPARRQWRMRTAHRSTVTRSGFGSQCKACKNTVSSHAYLCRTYKITRRGLHELREQQGDRCAICDEASPQDLDHDHETGNIRQLSCQRCNHALGLFRDDPRFLRAAADYVERHRARQSAAGEGSAGCRPGAPARPGTPPVGSAQRRNSRSSAARRAGHPQHGQPSPDGRRGGSVSELASSRRCTAAPRARPTSGSEENA
jgi:hypothetical protein